MAILAIQPPSRQMVAFVGAVPAEAAAAFKARGFAPEAFSSAQLGNPGLLSGVAAVVFNQPQSPERFRAFADELAKLSGVLLDFDCRVLVRATKRGLTTLARQLENMRLPLGGLARPAEGPGAKEQPWLPYIALYSEVTSWDELANHVTSWPAGRAPNLTVYPQVDKGRPLSAVAKLLVQRAFHDCSIVHLTEMEEVGHSGVAVYRAYAARRSGVLGQWLQPFFIKVGARAKVLKEYQNYVDRVTPYVPFHLGPHLDLERCALGATNGILVGDFVDESESLTTCASHGRAAPALACLFDRTLRGWHRGVHVQKRALQDFLWFWEHMELGPARMEAAKKFGATLEVADLTSRLKKTPPLAPVLCAPIHGDLHAGNVLVRGGDAILIDFYRAGDGPLVVDAALLESSLLVSGLAGQDLDPTAWFRAVERMYDPGAVLTEIPAHANPRSPVAWFQSCVRQIRMHARHVEQVPGQYAIALAWALAMKATKDKHASEPEASRRAAAYAFAERLVLRLEKEGGDGARA